MTPSGYLLVTEPEGDEVAAAIALKSLTEIPPGNLERFAEPVLYVPWSTAASSVLDQMRTSDCDVAAVVNEFGETIGILTVDDILDTIFMPSPSRSERLMDHEPLQPAGAGLWHVTGMTSRRQLQRYFQRELPESKSQTVGGILQEVLQRLPQVGDQCQWGPFEFRVLRLPRRGQLVVELALMPGRESSE